MNKQTLFLCFAFLFCLIALQADLAPVTTTTTSVVSPSSSKHHHHSDGECHLCPPGPVGATGSAGAQGAVGPTGATGPAFGDYVYASYDAGTDFTSGGANWQQIPIQTLISPTSNWSIVGGNLQNPNSGVYLVVMRGQVRNPVPGSALFAAIQALNNSVVVSDSGVFLSTTIAPPIQSPLTTSFIIQYVGETPLEFQFNNDSTVAILLDADNPMTSPILDVPGFSVTITRIQ